MEKKKHRKAKKILLIFACVIVVLAVGVFALLKNTFLKSFPELTGEPEIGKWYEVKVDGTQSSDGSEWHGIFKKGTENKVVVYFFGGGVSIKVLCNEYDGAGLRGGRRYRQQRRK